MEALKNELKDVITRKIVNATEGRACIGCEFAEFPHTCGSSMKDKIENKFNQVWFEYITQNSYKIKMKLRKAILEEIHKVRLRISVVEVGAEDPWLLFKW